MFEYLKNIIFKYLKSLVLVYFEIFDLKLMIRKFDIFIFVDDKLSKNNYHLK